MVDVKPLKHRYDFSRIGHIQGPVGTAVKECFEIWVQAALKSMLIKNYIFPIKVQHKKKS